MSPAQRFLWAGRLGPLAPMDYSHPQAWLGALLPILQITVFMGGLVTVPSHGWSKWHCFTQITPF